MKEGRLVRWFAVAAVLLLVLCLLSIAVGSRQVPLDQVLAALFGRPGRVDPQIEAIIWNVRLPRTAAGLLIGAALGLSGALMQGLTRNPLADPGLLGVSAGAAFGVVVAVALFGVGSPPIYVLWAFVGALGAAVAVHVLGGLGRGGPSLVKTALAGIAVTFLLGSFTSALVLRSPESLNRYRFWAAGSLAAPDSAILLWAVPFVAGGTVLALAAAPTLNSLALGDDVAAALGRRLVLARIQATLAITVLAGTAVAVAGPIVFIGLVTPHLVRTLVGPDHRSLFALTLLAAPILLLAADITGRVVVRPEEIQAGIVVAFLGGPFFIALVRRRRLAEL